ncbi:ISAs1 family transposase [Candidatus Fukatsuia symbiotica]|nr:ISAs1 family transposase [Candidatus Fukatsuia symbiotica]MEA9445091.1 ISAs1 family transposase [Candidatus Fukatsuia symbiotica]MEA9446257.1 ISAs1 family transposase [Candidatus Fukatsuia symbiotica]
MLNKLFESFMEFPDPRCAGRTAHRFIDVLVIAVCAVIAGAETWIDIALYGRSKKDWLSTFLTLEGGLPSHDTFRRVFSIIDPVLFEQRFSLWVKDCFLPIDREVVAIDGKTVRGSFDRAAQQGPLHMVSAFATEQGISLGQRAVENKSNEIAALPVLLDSLSVKGNIVTLDAMGCQRVIAQKIIAQQADYILALKGNQKKCHKAVVDYCHTTCIAVPAAIKPDYDAFDDSHGRRVRRRGWVLPCVDKLAELQAWPELRNIILIENIRSINHRHKTTCELHYYLSSCNDAAEIQIAAIRKHWAIENSLHWVLDVTFREDDSRVRDKVATRTFALLRKMALNIVRKDTANKASLRGRRKCAGWDDEYMEHLLFRNDKK